MISIYLGPGEMRTAEFLAARRELNNQGVEDRKQHGGNSFLDRYFAHCAELAVAKAFNLYPDFSVKVESAPPWDLRTATGYTVDVKWSRSQTGGDLVVPVWKSSPGKRCDVYVMTYGRAPSVGIWGYVKALDLFEEANRRGRDYVVPFGSDLVTELNQGGVLP